MIKHTSEFFRGFDDIPLHKYLGITLAEVRPDYARLRLTRSDQTPTGIGGSVNGGVIATMVDMAAVAASLNGLSPDVEPAGTADLAVTYLRPAFGDWVDATASVIKRGRQLSSIEVKVESSEQKLCAHGRVLYASRVSSN